MQFETPDVSAAALPHLVSADSLTTLIHTQQQSFKGFITQGHISTLSVPADSLLCQQ